jgi:hypothetical protein
MGASAMAKRLAGWPSMLISASNFCVQVVNHRFYRCNRVQQEFVNLIRVSGRFTFFRSMFAMIRIFQKFVGPEDFGRTVEYTVVAIVGAFAES